MPSPENAEEVLVDSIIGIVSEHTNFELVPGVSGSRIWVTKITISVGSQISKTVRIHFEGESVLNGLVEGGNVTGTSPIVAAYPHAIPGPVGKSLQVDLATIGSTDISVHYILEAIG